MDLQTYKKLKQETNETLSAFGKSSLLELDALEEEARKLDEQFVAQLETIKAEELRKKLDGTPASL